MLDIRIRIPVKSEEQSCIMIAFVSTWSWRGCVDISPSTSPLAIALGKTSKKKRLDVEFGAPPVTALGVILCESRGNRQYPNNVVPLSATRT